MKIESLFDQYRNHYLKQFAEQRIREKHTLTEVLIEYEDQDLEHIFNLARIDFVRENYGDPKMIEFNTDGFLNHEVLSFKANGKTISISPVVWNGVEVAVNDIADDFAVLKTWARRWIDPNDEKPRNDLGFQGVIHSVTKPEKAEGRYEFQVDLGTAPTEAAVELIKILILDPAVKTIQLSSKWMTDPS